MMVQNILVDATQLKREWQTPEAQAPGVDFTMSRNQRFSMST